MSAPRPLLELRGLGCDLRSGGMTGGSVVRAVDSVDLRVLPGEAVGIVGESGSGKTTLARCAVALLAPTSGQVLFDGMDLAPLDAAALRRKRREFQIIFQDAPASLSPRMTVARIIAEPFEAQDLGSTGERAAWVRDLAQSVALDPSLLERHPYELSGGQQQRVVIARALALRPRLVVADEPTAALDPSVQAQILNLLADLRARRGLALLLISHSLPVVRHLCDRVLVMYSGRIVEEAPAEPFFAAPKHPYSRLLLSSTTRGLDEAPRRDIPAEPPEARSMSGCAFHPRCSEYRAECALGVPPLLDMSSGNKVACFLYTSSSRMS